MQNFSDTISYNFKHWEMLYFSSLTWPFHFGLREKVSWSSEVLCDFFRRHSIYSDKVEFKKVPWYTVNSCYSGPPQGKRLMPWRESVKPCASGRNVVGCSGGSRRGARGAPVIFRLLRPKGGRKKLFGESPLPAPPPHLKVWIRHWNVACFVRLHTLLHVVACCWD